MSRVKNAADIDYGETISHFKPFRKCVFVRWLWIRIDSFSVKESMLDNKQASVQWQTHSYRFEYYKLLRGYPSFPFHSPFASSSHGTRAFWISRQIRQTIIVYSADGCAWIIHYGSPLLCSTVTGWMSERPESCGDGAKEWWFEYSMISCPWLLFSATPQWGYWSDLAYWLALCTRIPLPTD